MSCPCLCLFGVNKVSGHIVSVFLLVGSWLGLVVVILPRRVGVSFLVVAVLGSEWGSWQSAGLFVLLHDLLDALVDIVPRLMLGLLGVLP